MKISENNNEEVLNILRNTTAKQFYLYLAHMLKIVGNYMIGFGEAQRSSPLFVVFQKMPTPSIEAVTIIGSKLIDEIDEKKIGPLLKTLANVPPLPDLTKPLDTTAEEKINAGKASVEIGERIEALLK